MNISHPQDGCDVTAVAVVINDVTGRLHTSTAPCKSEHVVIAYRERSDKVTSISTPTPGQNSDRIRTQIMILDCKIIIN